LKTSKVETEWRYSLGGRRPGHIPRRDGVGEKCFSMFLAIHNWQGGGGNPVTREKKGMVPTTGGGCADWEGIATRVGHRADVRNATEKKPRLPEGGKDGL